MRAFLLFIFLSTSATAAVPPDAMSASCREAAAPAQAPLAAPDGWILLAALVVCAAGRWSR